MARPDPHPAARSPLGELLAVATPSVVTMISYPLKQFVDARMVAELGPDALAGQGNGAIAAFLIISFVYGGLTVVNTYVAQHLGAGRPEQGPSYAWNGLWICLFAALAMLALAAVIGPIFSAMGHAEAVLRAETDYARILLSGAFFTVAARGLHQFFYGVHRPMTVMVGTLIGNAVNILLDYAMIFGHWGFPAMGVEGAALATVIGSGVEFAIPLAVFLSPKYHLMYRTRLAWRLSTGRIAEILRLGWPTGLQYGSEIACWGVFITALVGSFGAEQNAAGWIALRYMQLSFMPVLGLSFAVTAVVGRHLGRSDPATAEHRARLGLKMGMVYMGLCGLAMVVFRDPMVRFFVGDMYSPAEAQEVMRIGRQVMILAAIFQVSDALGIVLMGALRGAGDTVWPGVVTLILSWSIIVGGGAAMMVLAPGLESLGPWIAAALYIIALGVAMWRRFKTGPWRSIVLMDRGEPEPSSGTALRASGTGVSPVSISERQAKRPSP